MTSRLAVAHGEALAAEWEDFARRIRLDLDRFAPEERDIQEARRSGWPPPRTYDAQRRKARPASVATAAGRCSPPRRSLRRRMRCARRSKARSRSALHGRATPSPMRTGAIRGEPSSQP